MEHASFLSFYVTLYRCASGPDFAAINHTRWRSVFTFGIIWPAFLGRYLSQWREHGRDDRGRS